MKKKIQPNSDDYKKALIYCRVSSGKQVTEGNGLESQEQRCVKYALEKGYEVEYLFRDEGISGGLFDRPAMQELTEYLDIHQGQKYVVIFDDLKRFARDVRVHLQLRTTFEMRGARLECPNFNFEDSPEGEFVEIIMAATAQLERSQNRRQVIQKQRARLEGGYWSFHAPPGLKFKRDSLRGKILVPNEPIASIFKDAYQKFAEYKLNTLEQVRQYILEQYKFYNIDRKLALNGVDRILKCPLYAGLIEYAPWGIPLTKGKHDGFIPVDLFHAVQIKLGNNAKPRLRKDYKEDFPLRNYLYCTDCRKPMTGSWHKGRSGTRYAHYFCKSENCPSKNKVFAKDVVQKQFNKLLKKSQPDNHTLDLAQGVLLDIWKDRAKRETDKKAGEVNELMSLDGKISTLLQRLTEASTQSVIQHYEAELTKLSNKKTAIEADLAIERYSREQLVTATEVVFSKLKDPMSLWKSDDYTEKRLMLGMYFENGIYYNHTKGLVKPELPILIRLSQNRNSGSNLIHLVEMARVKLASKTFSPLYYSQD